MPILRRTIIGLMLIVGLTVQATSVHAIYSPTISNRVNLVKQHVLAAQGQNGTGSLMAAKQKLIEQDKIDRAAGRATGLPAMGTISFGKVMGLMIADVFRAPLDSIFMVFNILHSRGEVISTCLRNDIWTLESLRDVVSQEMIKSYMMKNNYHGDLLMIDYDYLRNEINLLKKHGNHPTDSVAITILEDNIPKTKRMAFGQYLFGHTNINPYSFWVITEQTEAEEADETECKDTCYDGCYAEYSCKKGEEDECTNKCAVVSDAVFCKVGDDECTEQERDNCEDRCEDACDAYEDCADKCDDGCEEAARIEWSGCPESELFDALNEVMESFRNLKTIGSFQAADWGSIWEMAEVRARQRADQWIKANQITLTIGGEEGGNPQSLINDGGLDRMKGKFKTEIRILKDMVGPLVPLFTWSIYKNSEGGISPGCMYYYSSEGVYKACTVDQLLDYKDCRKNETAATKAGINCDLYKNPTKLSVGLDIIKGYQQDAILYQQKLERVETAYVYHTQLNSVNEASIEAIEKILSETNAEIKRAYEANGEDSAKPLATMYNQLGIFAKNHCGGQ